MNNRGQFYILTAIVLCSVVFAFATRVADISSPFQKSEFLYENYIQEAHVAINSALLGSGNVSERFIEFTDEYVYYSRSVDANFSQVVVLLTEDILILDRFSGPVEVSLYDEHEKYERRSWIALTGNDNFKSDQYLDIKINDKIFTIPLDELEDYAVSGIYRIDNKFYRYKYYK